MRGQAGQVAGDFGQQVDEVGVAGGGGVGGRVQPELGLDRFAFGVQGGVVVAQAAAVFLRRLHQACRMSR